MGIRVFIIGKIYACGRLSSTAACFHQVKVLRYEQLNAQTWFYLAILIHLPAGYRRIRKHENWDAVSSSPHKCTVWYGIHSRLHCLP